MNVLLVRANPRKEGFTQHLTDLFAKGLRETPAQVTDVDLTALGIQPCVGCYHCWLDQPGQCVHQDAMSDLIPRLVAAQVLVCATPLYYFSMSSYLKVFFERLLPVSAPGMETSRQGRARNRLRDPARWGRKSLITLVTGAFPDAEAYAPLERTFGLIADTLDMEVGGQLIRPESYLLPYRYSKPRTLKRIERAFLNGGREAGTSGRLSAATQADARLPLAADAALYQTYCNIYWQHAAAPDAQPADLARLHARVGSDPDILMREMARSIDPQTTARLRAVFQFDFTDARRHYRLTVDHGHCTLEFASTPAPDLRVTCDLAVWVALFTRQLGATDALRERRLTLEGDKRLFAKLDRYFPPPSL